MSEKIQHICKLVYTKLYRRWWEYGVYRNRRAHERANVRAGGYTDGTPMSHEDKVIYAWLTHVSIGGLALLLVTVTILVTLGAVGK